MLIRATTHAAAAFRKAGWLLAVSLAVQLPTATLHFHHQDAQYPGAQQTECVDPDCPLGPHNHAHSNESAFHYPCLACVWGGSANFTFASDGGDGADAGAPSGVVLHERVFVRQHLDLLPPSRAPPARA